MIVISIKRSIQTGNKPIAIYYSDPDGEAELDGNKCRKLSDIGSGQERTFDIPISDGEFFAVLEEGDERKSVARFSMRPDLNYGKLYLNKNKNTDNNSDLIFSERVENPSIVNSRVIGVICIIACILMILLVYAAVYIIDNHTNRSKSPKDFETEEFSITLTKAFARDFTNENAYAAFYSGDPCEVYAYKESFSIAPDLKNMTLFEYCLLLQKANGEDLLIQEKDGMMYYTSDVKVGSEECIFYIYVFKTDDAFWFFEFISTKERSYYWEKSYHEWAKSIKFK